MTTTDIDSALVGTWKAHLSFTAGPRRGEHEQLHFTFLPDGVIVGVAAIRAARPQVPPASGEWTVDGDRFSYWPNAVINDPSGRPRTVVHAHAEGELAPDGHAFRASGGSEFYAPGGELLATNRAELRAIRADASQHDVT